MNDSYNRFRVARLRISSKTRLGVGLVLFAVLLTLVIWQGSFTFGDYGPSTPEQVYVFWGLSSIIFVLTVLLGFMLFRTAIKMYTERQRNLEGSRIRTRLVIGALGLTLLPSFLLVVWSLEVLNRNLDKWFSRPAVNIRDDLSAIARTMNESSQETADILARWLALYPPIREYLDTGHPPAEGFQRLCAEHRIASLSVEWSNGRVEICSDAEAQSPGAPIVRKQPLAAPGAESAELVVRMHPPLDLTRIAQDIERNIQDYDRLSANKKATRTFYIQLLLAITLFLVFVAVWVALFQARQLVVPITGLMEAARRVRSGDFSHRIQVAAIDELGTLVQAFNEMTETLESNRRELEQRRRFTEAILESIPTGVISLSRSGAVQRINPALVAILSGRRVEEARNLSDLFTPEEEAEVRHLMRRSLRMGVCSSQLEASTADGVKHLGLTVSALEGSGRSGFVLVIEDNSEMLRAQKAAAWREVARRIAHEIKNPLTPIALCAERIARQLEKGSPSEGSERILRECVATILGQVESLKTLVNEFSQFARWPAVKLEPGSLNEVVEHALEVFAGRLDGIQLVKDLAAELPPVNIDREQFKRVIVNLVDNAAEAMTESPLKRLYIGTHPAGAEAVELVVADTGYGISPENKAKLFLPHFSTKNRGTGLGLAIVSHIVQEHNAQIRVESNQPQGARFIIEIPALLPAESLVRQLEPRG